MRRRQAHEQKRAPVRQHLLAARLMAVEIIAQQGGVPWGDAGTPVLSPARAGIEFAVLLGRPILGSENSGANGHIATWPGATITGVTATAVLGLAVGKCARAALLTMNRRRAVIVGVVEHHQYATIGIPAGSAT